MCPEGAFFSSWVDVLVFPQQLAHFGAQVTPTVSCGRLRVQPLSTLLPLVTESELKRVLVLVEGRFRGWSKGKH